MDIFFLGPLGLVLLALIFIVNRYKNTAINKVNTLAQTDTLLSVTQRSFYGLLCQTCLGERNSRCKSIVFAKIGLHDILLMQRKLPVGQRQTHLKALAKINFDFVICRRTDLSVIAVIELQDERQLTPKNAKRVAIITKKCRFLNLPYHQFELHKRYSVEALVEQIFAHKNL